MILHYDIMMLHYILYIKITHTTLCHIYNIPYPIYSIVYIHIHIYHYMYLSIYCHTMYRERERERERDLSPGV